MREGRKLTVSVLTGLAVLAVAAFTAGCIEAPELVTPEAYNYESTPILINNPDWGVIPLPNNFLNPVKQGEFVYFPGMPMPEAAPVYMALPITDAAAVEAKAALGYTVPEDSDLTKTLVAGMNKLDGWVTSFAPKIPFSKLPDYDSLVPYDGTNGATANLFLLDITDTTTPIVIMPAEYYRVINFEGRTEMPYYLSLRLIPGGPLQPPADFLPGHTYMVVVTGMNADVAMDLQTGVKANVVDAEDNPTLATVQVDSTFLVFAAEDKGGEMFTTTNPITQAEVGLRYINVQGAPVNSILTGLPAVQQAEGARQITNYVIKIWENLTDVKDVRKRTEIVAAFHWTTVSNPMPMFFNATNALMGGNAVVPEPADFVDGTGALQKAASSCTTSAGFQFKSEVAIDTITADTVKVFKVSGDTAKVLEEVAATVTPTNDGGITKVVVKPTADLTPATQYMVVATNGIKNVTKTRAAVEETYFGLTRVGLPVMATDGTITGYADNPLVSDDGNGGMTWNSPNLDSTLDTLILGFSMEAGIDPVGAPLKVITEEMRIAAKSGMFGVIPVLKNLEALRTIYKPLFDALVLDNKLVERREDIIIGWTFTTGACN